MEILRLMAILLLIILVIAIGSKIIYRDNYAILTGTLENGQAIISEYPEGFNNTNCVILSIMTSHPDHEGQWAIGNTFNSAAYVSGSIPIRAYMKNEGIVLQAKNIILTNEQSVGVYDLSVSFKYKIVLMKIS